MLQKQRKKIGYGLLAALALIACIYLLEKAKVIDVFSFDEKSSVVTDNDAKTTSTAPTAQDSFTDGDRRDIPNRTSDSEGYVKDDAGNIASLPPRSQWSTSQDSNLIVYSPANGSVLNNGDVLIGETSETEKVSFRLIDNISGVIARGEISVVDGKFSGTFIFSTTATIGRLDVFVTETDGKEISNIEIPVKF
ncbi:hypothetical protein EOL73_02600 [Candidatus Saccharibacteria bacterium]|nr:hypothetical protein [Candidatus Saccharibacteria bacterium]